MLVRVQVSKRVQVSRMMSSPFAYLASDVTPVTSVPIGVTHSVPPDA
jgi:hypothetical protein